MIAAIVLAAGESKRMGKPKMLLPWGAGAVLQATLDALRAAGVTDILVITGGARARVEALVGDGAQTLFNAEYASKGMLGSIQAGLRAKADKADAALVCLGDQPQMREATVRRILAAWKENRTGLVVPSFENRRGHPWLIARAYWDEILAMSAGQTMRDFFARHAAGILYVPVETPTILQDLDTPEDYLKFKP